VYNANNQLTQWGTTAMTYDANGSTLSDGTNSYVWDARNRLVSADNSGGTFSYDPLGRRVSKTILSTTTNFLYDGVNAVQEFGTLPTANLLTGGVDERFTRTTATETDNYLTDALGSTVALTDAAGNSVAQYSYAPFGSLSASGATTSNSYTYTGRESDGLGINYYRARYYNPTTGRFLSEDPLGFAGSGTNFYAYAGNNPISFRDPSGKCLPTALAGAAIGGGAYVLSHRKDFTWGGMATWTGAGALAGCGLGFLAESALAAGLAVPEGTGALYAGAGGLEAASDSGLAILADTPAGSLANTLLQPFPEFITQPIWNYLSSLFADGLTGDVSVFLGDMGETQFGDSILINTELPIVQANFGSTVTNIIYMVVP